MRLLFLRSFPACLCVAVQGRSLLSDKTSVANNGHSFLEAMPRFPSHFRFFPFFIFFLRTHDPPNQTKLGTRNNWEGDSVSSQFCSWNAATNTCNWSDYAQSISIILLAPAILGSYSSRSAMWLALCANEAWGAWLGVQACFSCSSFPS